MRIYVFFYFALVLFLVGFIEKKNNDVNYQSYTIYLDPGHGGMDGGSVSDNVLEKDINLSICLVLKECLENKGYTVYLTRDGDYHLCSGNFNKREDLHARIEKINQSNPDLYLSIHVNKFTDERYYGAQVFYNNIHPNNYFIASKIQEKLCTYTNTKRKVKHLDNIIILKKITVPGCLVECGFISNPNERNLLLNDEYLRKLSNCIIGGIEEYLLVI